MKVIKAHLCPRLHWGCSKHKPRGTLVQESEWSPVRRPWVPAEMGLIDDRTEVVSPKEGVADFRCVVELLLGERPGEIAIRLVNISRLCVELPKLGEESLREVESETEAK